MGLYNILFGEFEHADPVLKMLELSKADFGRYRDVFLFPDRIGIYTRCGGGNREDYQWVFEKMEAHPLYMLDEDDAFDCTYCTFYFRVPPEHNDLYQKICSGEEMSGDERWIKFLSDLKGDSK